MLRSRLSEEGKNMNEIIKRYRILEEGMKKMTKQAKKRTVLEDKIINLGMDCNLVKNKCELFQE